MKRSSILLLFGLFAIAVFPLLGQDRRARPPRFGSDSFRGVFVEDLSSVVAASRPSVQELRGIKPKVAGATPEESQGGGGGEGWQKLASGQSLEDEVKSQKLMFDQHVAQPGAFKSGGYVKARLQLSILATLFGVIANYEGEVKWKKDAEAARNLLARSAGNCNSGSIQVFNECKARKQDLDDLLRGSGISSPPAAEETDWSRIADRSLLMEYLGYLASDQLPDMTNSDSGVKDQPEAVKRLGDMVALVGHVMIQEGMDEADDEEYVLLAKQMRDAAVLIAQAADEGNADAARKAVGAVNQSCDACHEQYR